jgi:hypothetical protein
LLNIKKNKNWRQDNLVKKLLNKLMHNNYMLNNKRNARATEGAQSVNRFHGSSSAGLCNSKEVPTTISSAGLCNSKEVQGQGTIEYLIIIAIIVVIGLVVTGLSTNMFDTQQITRTTGEIKGQIGSGGISVIDTVANYEGDGYLNLKNTSGETITLTKIATTETENEYDNIQWTQENTKLIQTENLCTCEAGQTTKTCEIEIYYTTKHGLEKKNNTNNNRTLFTHNRTK